MMQLKGLICDNCGEPLHKEGDLYVCKYCGATYEIDRAEEISDAIECALGAMKVEKLANAKKLLYDAVHARFPSEEAVVDNARLVLSIHQEETLAEVYLHSHDADPYELIRLLANGRFNPVQAQEVYRWLLPSLNARTVGPLKDFVLRHFTNEERSERLNEIEAEAGKIEEGIYVHTLPRDVFLAYSSSDMPKVIETIDVLEENGFQVFAAFRNMRHGKGAAEDYLKVLKEAMAACSVFVFLSSDYSRQMTCDAMKVELPYLTIHLPKKKRIEFLLSDYPARVPLLVRDTLKKAFPSQEQCRDYDDLVLRVQSLLTEQDEEGAQSSGLSFNGQGDDLLAAIEQAQKIREEREAAEKQRQLEEEEKRRKEEERKERERVAERRRQEEIAWAKAEAARIKAGWDIVDGIVKKCRLNDQRLVVPDEVVEFGPSCFDQKVDFSMVKVLVLPKGLKAFEIAFDISERFRGLEKIEIDKTNTSFESIDGVLYTRGLERLICCPAKPNWGMVTLPVETKIIAEHAFDNVELKEVKTSSPLTVLPDAFLRCRFDHITIPSQSKIESGAFTASKGKTLLIESMCKVASSAFSGAEFWWLFIKERKPLIGLPPNWSRDALKNYFSVKPSWI